jgi:hypothetical protein
VGPTTGLDDVEKRRYLTLPGLELDPSVIQPVAKIINSIQQARSNVWRIRPWRWRQYISPKYWLTLTTLHGITSQKTEQFIHLNFWKLGELGHYVLFVSLVTTSSSVFLRFQATGYVHVLQIFLTSKIGFL